ncbi:MAG: tetratricopeptide repeat protein [Clostridia bacterium]|nr:tetratricopeptide repeat protein [Clostridia bacterium]
MKKLTIVFLCFCVVFGTLFAPLNGRAVLAAGTDTTGGIRNKLLNSVVLFVGSSNGFVKNNEVKIDTSNMAVAPVVKNGRTLVPVGFIANSLGAKVGWDKKTSTITITSSNKVIKLTLKSKKMTVNGKEVVLDVPAQSINGRTFIPLAKLCVDALGKQVFYDRGLIVISDIKNIFDKNADKDIIDGLIGVFKNFEPDPNTGLDYRLANALVDEGYKFYYDGSCYEAIEYFDRSVQISTQVKPLAYYGKALSLHFLMQYEEAIKYYDKVLELDSEDSRAYHGKGNALTWLDRYEDAIECYDKALELDDTYVEVYKVKGDALTWLNRYMEALGEYDNAIALNENYDEAYVAKGDVFNTLEMYEEAVECFDSALEINPDNSQAHNGKGVALDFIGNYEDALAYFGNAVELDPNFAIAYNNMGNVLYRLERLDEAIEAYNEAIEIDPQYKDAYNNKGYILLCMDKYQEALKNCEKAIELDAEFAGAYYNKSCILIKLDKVDEALVSLAKAIELDSSYKETALEDTVFDDIKTNAEFIKITGK